MSEIIPLLRRQPDGGTKDGLPWSKRLHHFTWAWFEVNMSTGALATLIGQQLYNFIGLGLIGWALAILNIALFIFFSGLITYRFSTARGRLLRSLHHPHESFFFGAYFVSIAMILYCVDLYAVPITGSWLLKTIEVLYWVYAGIVMLVAVFQYHIIFDREKLPVADALSSCILPVYPFLNAGRTRQRTSQEPAIDFRPAHVHRQHSIPGSGVDSGILYAHHLRDSPHQYRPPCTVQTTGHVRCRRTSLVHREYLCSTGHAGTEAHSRGLPGHPLHPRRGRLQGCGCSGRCVHVAWFSSLSTVGVLISIKEAHFTLNWWGFIFPNVGLFIALLQLADAMDLSSVKVVFMVATVVVLFVLWVYVAIMNIRAVIRREVLWPGRDEDMEDITDEPESAPLE